MLCPNFQRDGVCGEENCPHNHARFTCELCGVSVRTQEYYNSHMNGNKHAAAVRARNSPTIPKKCIICDLRLGNSANVSTHLRGRRHQVRLLELRDQGRRVDERTVVIADGGDTFDCSICEITVWQMSQARHEQTQRHKRKEQFLSIRAALQEAEKDKHGVVVSPSGKDAFDLGINETGRATLNFLLQTDNSRSRIYLRRATLLSAAQNQSSFKVNIPTMEYLSTSAPLEGTVAFNSQGSRGRFQDRLELAFGDYDTLKQFAIVKTLSALVGNKEDYEALKPISPYIPKKQTRREPMKEVTPGERPPALAAIQWVVRLDFYDIPTALQTALDRPILKDRMRLVRSAFVPPQLTSVTHAQKFHALLHMEEHQSAIDIERYDQEEEPLERDPDGLYYLKVPGLSEKRPSLIVGDFINVKHHGGKSHWWQGYVHKVRLSEVGLRFNPAFKPLKGQKFDVHFTLNRLTIRRMHQALDTRGLLPRLLFPTETHIQHRKPSEATIRTLNPINRLIGANPPQMLAVTAIRNLPPGSPPFIVFGPPGTGKTITIIEAIRQILLVNPKSKTLACAPSNSAADIIAERLTVLGKSQLFRLNAASRPAKLLPVALQDFSRRNAQGTFEVPKVEELARFRVIVSTCLSASVPYGIGIEPGHFSHVFIDEAGQAREPEALIPIKTLVTPDTNVILSGDPKQLGPIIRSNVALHFNFGVSLLDRLTAMPIYDELEKNGVTIVKLVQNFRSHPSILMFPNERFYRGDLEVKADPMIIYSMNRAECIVKPGFPVVFHSIAGKDLREASSPSFFNIDEASLVKKYIRELKADQRLRLKDEHIGVISPYNAQCHKIRGLLSHSDKDIKVGSVEEFQGQERRVIIVSTVRSNLDFVESDINHSLGFVANPRRFNVAMTRAQALLIVIGDPNVLHLDPLWRSFLNYIFNNGGWTGRPAPCWDTRDPTLDCADVLRARRAQITAEEEDLIARIATMVDSRVRSEDMDDLGDGYEAVERPWPEAE